MMRLFVKSILVGCIFVTTGTLCAQNISPWFRLKAGVPFETIKHRAFTMEHLTNSATALSKPLLGNPTKYAVKTTMANWLNHKLQYSHSLSAMEKKIFKHKDSNLFASSAKLHFFYDRDLLLAKALPSLEQDQWNRDAFLVHQNLMETTRREIEVYGLETMAHEFSQNNFFLNEEEVFDILRSSQAPSFILTRAELNEFPKWTLEQQRYYALQKKEAALRGMLDMFNRDPNALETKDFISFLYLKYKAYYFSKLCNVLEKASTPRKTLIIRLKKSLPVSFLPNPHESLTDAQRLGKLQFYLDFYTQDVPDPQYAEILAAEQIAQRTGYSYAQAETLGIPYENLLGGKVLRSEMIFPNLENRLSQLDRPQDAVAVLDELLEKQTAKMADFRRQHPQPELTDYANYYHLFMEKEILQVLRIRLRPSFYQ